MCSRSAVALVFVSAILSGCAEDSPSELGYQLSDSAGTRFVDWTLGHSVVYARLGDTVLQGADEPDDPRDDLYEVVGGVTDAAGRVLIANSGGLLLLFDSSGGLEATGGGTGDGPGEFRSIGWMQRQAGDTVAVYDARRSSLSMFLFTDSLRFLRREFGGISDAPAQLIGRFARGTVLGSQRVGMANPGPTVRGPTGVLHLRGDGSADTLFVVPGSEYVVLDGVLLTPLFGREPLFAVGSAAFYYADSEHHRIERRRMDGGVELTIRKPQSVRSVLPADREAIERPPYPEVEVHTTFPALEALLLDLAGNLWAREYPRPTDSEATWNVYDPQGLPLGIVRIPARMKILEIGSDYVVGVIRDDLDVERLEVRSLHRLTQRSRT